jgi:hypothetical protein
MRMGRELQLEETKRDAAAKTDHQRRMKVVAKTNRQRAKAEKREKY